VKGIMAVVIETSGDEEEDFEDFEEREERERDGNAEEWALFKLGRMGRTQILVADPHPEARFYCVMACYCLWLSRGMINDQLIFTF